MYIYKLITQNGNYYIGNSAHYPELTGSQYNSQLAEITKLNDSVHHTELLAEVPDDSDISMIKFLKSIESINETHDFKLMNGRFRVDNQLKELDHNYILSIYCKATHKWFIDSTRNVIDKLYRIFMCGRGMTALNEDIKIYNPSQFVVYIDGPFTSDEINDEWLSRLKGTVINNDPSNLYNPSKYYRLTKQGRYKGGNN